MTGFHPLTLSFSWPETQLPARLATSATATAQITSPDPGLAPNHVFDYSVGMWTQYVQISSLHPFAAAFVQFAFLGMLGEVLATQIKMRTRRYPWLTLRTLLKMLAWGALGIYIKLMFMTASGGVDALAHYGLSLGTFATAAMRSALMNLMLGPSMMILHRLSDNAIDRLVGAPVIGWAGLDKSMGTLVWLWIPLHTITFLQIPEVRVGIAAVLSLVLGVVMGYFGRAASLRR